MPNFSNLFRQHPNLSYEVNRNIVQSEIEGGVRLEDLQPGSRLHITTRNTNYQLLVLTGNVALITGHSLYCPRPVLVIINGSTWGGSMLKVRFIGRGMCMEFVHPQCRTPSLPLSSKKSGSPCSRASPAWLKWPNQCH